MMCMNTFVIIFFGMGVFLVNLNRIHTTTGSAFVLQLFKLLWRTIVNGFSPYLAN